MRPVASFIIALGFLMGMKSLPADVSRSKVKKGLDAYEKKQWDEALNQFQDALLDDPKNSLLHFNLGDVLYKKKKYEDALKSYQEALMTRDIVLQEKTYYNIGNTYYQMNKYPEAISAYKKALELDPDDLEAKHNLELVRAKLKEMAQKQPMEGNQQQQQGGSASGNMAHQNHSGKQNKDQQSEQQMAQQQEEEEPKQSQVQTAEQDRQQQQASDRQQVKSAEKKKELSKEEAERILEALRSKEQSNKKLRTMRRRAGRKRVEKDW